MHHFKALVLFLGAIGSLWAEDQSRYTVYRAVVPIKVDGQIDEKEWGTAPLSRDFADILGDAKPRPLFKTNVKMLFDDQLFYIAAILEEPHVWGTLTNHDAVIFHDNDFEVFIDPDRDLLNYYEVELNALNTTWDLRLTKPYVQGGKAIDSWEIIGLKTALKVHGTLNNPADVDQGWTIEIAIPWKAMSEFARASCPPKEGDLWPVNFSRVQWQVRIENGRYVKVEGKSEDNWTWGEQGKVDMHLPERWPLVKFSNKFPPNSPKK